MNDRHGQSARSYRVARRGRLRPRVRRGFTLVEALCAGIILALFATVIGTTMSQSIQAVGRAQDHESAAGWLDIVMTKIDAIGPYRLSRQGPTSGTLDDRFTWQADLEPLNEGDLFQITVTIEWQSSGGTYTIEGYTLLNDPPDSRPAALSWDDL